jgi:CDP-diglyceride synthetase
MSQRVRQAGDWHWLWDVYIVGGCLVGVAAVVVLNDRVPGNVPLAITALAGIIICTLTVGRRVIGANEFNWPAAMFVGIVLGLFVLALWAAEAAVAAIPAIYPLVFASLSLPAALVVSIAVTLAPLIIALAINGTDRPNMPVAVVCTLVGVVAAPVIGTVVVTSVRQRARLAGKPAPQPNGSGWRGRSTTP